VGAITKETIQGTGVKVVRDLMKRGGTVHLTPEKGKKISKLRGEKRRSRLVDSGCSGVALIKEKVKDQ